MSHDYTIETFFTVKADSAEEAALKVKSALDRGKYHFGAFELEALRRNAAGKVVESSDEYGSHHA